MPSPRMLFTNIAVADLDASKAFFGKLGFTFDERFTNEQAAAMPINDLAVVMLLQKDFFASFLTKPQVDATTATEATLCVSADSKAAVDALADDALGAGATPAKDPVDYGFMYGRSFNDPDGHHWEVMWMDPKAVEVGPEAFAAQNAPS
jgi:predicted lactoylglutathione lyase